MLFNLGCYLSRCGDFDKAMVYLRKAVAAGFLKEKSFRQDPDLAPLRSRADFWELLAEVAEK